MSSVVTRNFSKGERYAKASQTARSSDELTFLHAEEILDMYPDLPRKQRETQVLRKFPAIFIIGIGWPLEDGMPHEMRAADYDDWITPTIIKHGKQCFSAFLSDQPRGHVICYRGRIKHVRHHRS